MATLLGGGSRRRDGCFHRFVSEILVARGMTAPCFPERNLESLNHRDSVLMFGVIPVTDAQPCLGDKATWAGRVKQPSYLKSLLAFRLQALGS